MIFWNVHTGVGGTRAKWSLAIVSSIIWSHRWAQSGFCTCKYLVGGRLIQFCSSLEEKFCFQWNGWRKKKKEKNILDEKYCFRSNGWWVEEEEKRKWKSGGKVLFSIKQEVGGGDGSHTPGTTAAGQRHLVSCTPPSSSLSSSSSSSSSPSSTSSYYLKAWKSPLEWFCFRFFPLALRLELF